MDNLWNELKRMAAENLGMEKVEELDQASNVILALFRNDAEFSTLTSMMAISAGESANTALWAQFLTGCGMYREFMLQNGIDVDFIEQRVLEERRNKK